MAKNKQKLLAIKNEEGRGVYEFSKGKEVNELIKQHTGRLTGVSSRIFKINEKDKAMIWAGLKPEPTESKMLLAIKDKRGRGVYEFSSSKEINGLVQKHAGKLKGVSFRVFTLNEKEEANTWAGVNSKTEKAKETKIEETKKPKKLLAIRSEKGKGVYELFSEKDVNKVIQQHVGTLEGVSSRLFKPSQKEEAMVWTGLANKLLAIRSESGRGVYEFPPKKEVNKLIEQYAGKMEGVSFRIFKLTQREEAVAWAGLKPEETKEMLTETSKKEEKTTAPFSEKKSSTTPRKPPNEIELKTINMGMDCRTYLQWYYAEGGHSVAFGDFKGKIEKIEKDRILFKRLYIQFFEGCGDIVDGKEDHIWVFGKEPFEEKGVKVGDCVMFTALAYAYKRQDGSIDFSLKDCEDVDIIKEYELPTDEELLRQAAERIACEVCLFSSQCNGVMCIAADGYREEMIEKILELQKNMKIKE